MKNWMLRFRIVDWWIIIGTILIVIAVATLWAHAPSQSPTYTNTARSASCRNWG